MRRFGACSRGLRRVGFIGAQRQDVADFGLQALREHAAQAGALQFIVQTRVKRVYVDWQAALAPQVVPGVLMAGQDVLLGHRQAGGQGGNEAACVGGGVGAGFSFVGEQRRVLPASLAVRAPVNAQGPARQLFAGVPLALAKVQKAALAVLRAQLVHQLGRQAALGRAQGVGVPLRRVTVVHRHKGGFAAHGQAHVARFELVVHLLAQGQHGGPLFVAVRAGDARGLVDAGDRHFVVESDFRLVHQALNGRRG